MTFLNNLMSFGKPTEALTPKAKSGETRSSKTQAIYAELFATPTTITAAIAARKQASAEATDDQQDFSAVGMANQIYRYERKDLMSRHGVEDTPGRPVLWVWKGK